ncbi:MAG: hypothetical protein FWC23_08335 [Chitinispirillia bacterium]|nr:hypothetical protein [Chitinispirillia bacterium]MCL2269176.1 hypothetical protein [Chitinispirillia bacterium]
MTKRLPIILALTIIAVINTDAAAQRFPPELTYPRAVEEEGDDDGTGAGINTGAEADSASISQRDIHISVDQAVFDKSYTGINNFVYSHSFGNVSLEQGLWYELRRDRLQHNRHYINASGSLAWQLSSHGWLTPGLDWTPIAQYSSDRGGRNALSTIDIGPTAGFSAAGVPVNLRAGISGRRVDSLAGRFTVGDYRSSVGAYGAFQLGSYEDQLPFAPVYFYADGLGRRIEGAGMASVTSSALGALQVGERDSLFMYGDFTLFNGREGYLEGSADSRAALFTETPWRVERTVTATAGYKAGPIFIVTPSAYYSVSENRLEFLDDGRRRDEKTIRQTLSGALSTDSAAGLCYSGAMTFEWRGHDKLFGKNMAEVWTAANDDSLKVNLWDYSSFDPRTAHRVVLRLSEAYRLKYDFSLSRFLTEYPNFYISGRDTVTNSDDSDRRTRSQRLALEYKNDSTFRAEAFGEFIDYDLVFLKQAKSSSNRTDNTQRVGVIVEWAPANELLITEALSAEAKAGKFHFPAFHQKALQRPRYSRAVNSLFAAEWQATPLAGLSCKWNIKFSDYGYWYGREYMVEELANDSTARTGYYAIASKSVYYTTDLAVRLSPGTAIIEAGNAITVARDRNYRDGNYILSNEDGYSVKPYINAAVRIRGMAEVSAQLSRTFVVGNDALGYWDFRLQAEGGF